MLDRSLPTLYTEFSIYHPIRFHPTLIQILEGDHAVHTLKLEGHEAAYHRLGHLHRAAEEERPQGVGSGRPVVAKADANSRRGNSWRARRGGRAAALRGDAENLHRQWGTEAAAADRRTAAATATNPIAIPIARRGTREQVEGSG
jgi:hypothetical protein